MEKAVKRALRQMTPSEKIEAARVLLDSLNAPYIVTVEIEKGVYAGHHSKQTTVEFCDMIAGFLITVAQKNGMMPIKLLSLVGEVMSEMMNREEYERTSKANPASTKAAE